MPTIRSIPYRPDSSLYFSQLEDLPFRCWLDSGRPDCQYSRYDIITALPVTRILTTQHHSEIIEYHYSLSDTPGYRESPAEISGKDPFQLLADAINKLSKTKANSLPYYLPFCGGALGYFAYDLGRRYHGLDQHPKADSVFADMNIGIYHWALVQDHHLQRAWLASLPECHPDILEYVAVRIDRNSTKALTNPKKTPLRVSSLHSTTDKADYLQKLNTIKDYLLAGDCYQVNLSQCFQGDYTGFPGSAYQQLRKAMASPFSACLNLGNQHILSLSPERFLQVRGRQVVTQPIKGTIRRHANKNADAKLAGKLQNSPKDRAENLMIVDLLRNDLGQHCVPGSIRVDQLFHLQSFPNVHHLVSRVSGVLKDGAHSTDLLRDCFPGGSITGAPKKRAMEIIDELESARRGVYCGSIGYINNNWDMDTNIAIRTVSFDGKTLYCHGGSGIVADSEPGEEYRETVDKVKKILETLGKDQ